MKRARGVMIYVFAAGDAKFQQSDSQRLTATFRDSQKHTETHNYTKRLTIKHRDSQELTETQRLTHKDSQTLIMTYRSHIDKYKLKHRPNKT